MIKISRYPETKNKSLKVSSAADDYLLKFFAENKYQKSNNILLFNDRFGYLACHLNKWNPYTVINYKSQEKALHKNIKNNNLNLDEKSILSPLDSYPENIDFAFIRMPKSLDLFKLFLYQISKTNNENIVVVIAFMTKHFSKQMLAISNVFFENSEQSLAWKKSRLLILKNPKPAKEIKIINSFQWQEIELRQYLGVFSSTKVDYATQFLLSNIQLSSNENCILDLASGNGIIARFIHNKYINNNWLAPELHLLDDSLLAVESSKLNLNLENTFFHFNDNLNDFSDSFFDLIITNPPFHFEYEINTEISVGFFKQAYRCLKNSGRFVLVFNRHLPYKALLKRVFSRVELIAQNEKFIALECKK